MISLQHCTAGCQLLVLTACQRMILPQTDRHVMYAVKQNIKQQQQLLYIGVCLTKMLNIHHRSVLV